MWRHGLTDAEEDLSTSDPRWCEVHIRQITFPVPQTAEDALSRLVQEDYWENTPDAREDFFLDYQAVLRGREANVSRREGANMAMQKTLPPLNKLQ